MRTPPLPHGKGAMRLNAREVLTVATTLSLLGACTDSDVGRLTAPTRAASTNDGVASSRENLDAALRGYLTEFGYTEIGRAHV